MIFRTILVITLLSAGTFFVVRRIIALPSKYERKPKIISSWSALDEGTDPTLDPGKPDDESQP